MATLFSNVYAEDFTASGIMYSGNEETMTATVVGHEDSFQESAVVIPATVNGYQVVAIGIYAFMDYEKMTSVSLPDGLQSIGALGFFGCKNLTSIEIPNSVTIIDGDAFGDCTNLSEVMLPNSLTTITEFCFENCTSLTTIDIPNTVTSIGWSAFSGSGLAAINLPGSVTFIDDFVFLGCNNLVSVSIPNTVTRLGRGTFAACKNLEKLFIPASVQSIAPEINGGYNTVQGCSKLTSIIIEEGNPTYDSRNNCNAIVETATNELLAGCKGTVIPESVTSIRELAFQYSSITSIVIPSSIKTIKWATFWGCKDLTNITLPEGLETIEDQAFEECLSLQSLTIPESVTAIGHDAFYAPDALTAIKVVEGNTVYDSRNNCNALIHTASNKLILACMNTVIPETVTTIGEGAFGGIKSITSISIPESVTSIEGWAFQSCEGLTSITMPNNLKSIGERAFQDCTGLTSFSIPASVTEIGPHVFGNIEKSLSRIYSYNEEPTDVDYYAFWNLATSTTLYVPAGTKSKYEQRVGWQVFHNIVEIGTFVNGDVNGDGAVNVGDIMAVINYMAGQATGIDKSVADVNGDGNVNVGDIMAVINIMAGK